MKIKRSSWHYKISHLGGYERYDDSLCAYFWRLVGKLVLLFMVCVLVAGFLYGYFTSLFLIPTTIVLLFIVSCIVLPTLAIRYLRHILGKSPEIPYSNIALDYWRARKHRICPLIEYIN